MFVACYVASIGRILSLVDKGCSGMVSGRKLACTRAEFSGTSVSGFHAIAWLGASSGTHNVNPPTSDDHNFFFGLYEKPFEYRVHPYID